MKKVIAIIGARPQFIKHFPFEQAAKNKVNLITIHTGQHYDENMSAIFFNQLNMQKPKYILSNGGGNHGGQTGKMMIDIENILIDENPDGVVVYGDTNSTLSGALVAVKLQIPVFHIEAGLRSFNKKMPEEVNRILTDHVSSKLFATSNVALENLSKEGLFGNAILVGDIMKDLIKLIISEGKIGIKKINYEYFYVTIHRPYNTDNVNRLTNIFMTLNSLSKKVVIALHPRTKKMVQDFEIRTEDYLNLVIIEPQSYFDNLNYLYYSMGLITDSGGMQKEAYWLNKKCVTIRTETEWVETVILGGNKLMFEDLSDLGNELSLLPANWDVNLYGDGNAANNIVNEIVNYLN
jgi:UDP-GlcNAc3NAcA epimerase